MSHEIRSRVKQFSDSLNRGSKVLDVGCGLRPYEEFFSHCEYIGIDAEESGREAEAKKPDKFFKGGNIPFDDEQFDAVICTEVLEHCVAPEKLVSEMYRVLKKGGLLLVTVPFMWGEHEVPYDFRRYSTFGVQRLFVQAGFKLIHLGKLSLGIDAVAMLVDSEINNYNVNVKKGEFRSSLERIKVRFLCTLCRYVWRVQLKLWRKLYLFDRIYIDSVAVAVKD